MKADLKKITPFEPVAGNDHYYTVRIESDDSRYLTSKMFYPDEFKDFNNPSEAAKEAAITFALKVERGEFNTPNEETIDFRHEAKVAYLDYMDDKQN